MSCGLPLKEESRSIPQVTNPGQNGNQQMFVLCDWMGKEWGTGTYSSPKESPDRERKNIGAK